MSRILIIDDSQDLLEIFSLVLIRNGHETKTVLSPDEIQTSLAKYAPDLILLDVVLNGYDGREMCKALKETHSKNIPIILISANPNLLKDYEECNADAVIEKPFEIKTVIEQINIVLNQYQPVHKNKLSY